MKHLRGSGVAVVLIFLLAGVALASGDQIADLENKVAKMESMLKDESAELRPMILRELTAARRELRQALQERFDLLSQMAATTPEEQQAKTERLEKLRARIDELNRQLAAVSPAPASTPAPTSALPVAPSAPTAAGPAAAPPVPATTAPQAAPPALEVLDSAFAEAPSLPTNVKLRVDISREWKDPDVEKKCSNRPFSQSAKVWKLVVVADPVWGGQEKKLQRYFIDEKQNLFIPIATMKDNPKVAMVVGARTFLGHAERRVREVRLVFENLSVAEMSDLADHLANHADEIKRAYTSAIARYEIFQVAFVVDPQAKNKPNPKAFYRALTCNLDPEAQQDAFRQMLIDARKNTPLETCVFNPDPSQPRPAGIKIAARGKAPFDLTSKIQSAQLDTNSIQETKRMVGVLINNQADKWSSDTQEQQRITKKSPATNVTSTAASTPENARTTEEADQEEEDENRPTGPPSPALIIDQPCFQLSVSPLLSGNEFKPVASFRFRYDYYTADDRITMKLRAEGEGAEGGQYFQRVNIGGEATGLLGRGEKGWQVAGGGVGHYSFTRKNGMQVDEWQAGGKLQVQAPYIRLFDSRAGSDSRPTFSVEGAATGGNGSSTKAVDFGLTSSFRYTLRPNPRVSLDMKADGAWSNRPRYANEKTFYYVSAQGRFNLEASWDYVVRYECGRKEPDYRKFCGWQTGLVLVTGR